MKISYHEVSVSNGIVITLPEHSIIDGPRIVTLGRQDAIMSCVAWLERAD